MKTLPEKFVNRILFSLVIGFLGYWIIACLPARQGLFVPLSPISTTQEKAFVNQQKTSLSEGSLGKEIESPRTDNHVYGNTPNNYLSSSQWRRAGDSHSIPPFGGTLGLSVLAPSSGVYPPPNSLSQVLGKDVNKEVYFIHMQFTYS